MYNLSFDSNLMMTFKGCSNSHTAIMKNSLEEFPPLFHLPNLHLHLLGYLAIVLILRFSDFLDTIVLLTHFCYYCPKEMNDYHRLHLFNYLDFY